MREPPQTRPRVSPVGAGRRTLSSLPLRVRLVAGFVVAISLVLAAAGSFVYWRVSYALDLRLNTDLRNEAVALAPLVASTGQLELTGSFPPVPGAGRYQVLDAAGRVLAHGPELGAAPLLTPRQARTAVDGEVIADIGALLPASRRPLRLLTVPLPGPGPARVLLVADRKDARDEALRELLAQLLVAGLASLVVTAVVGERLAKAALTPVERYRAQAASIAAGARGVRLDVPVDRDDEVTRLGQTLNEVLEALEQAVDRERRFTQDASHELRTPLTLLSTRIQLARRRTRSASEHEATLRELGQDVDTLIALAEQLLQISTSDNRSGQREARRGTAASRCDLADIARAVTAERDEAARSADDHGRRTVAFSAQTAGQPLPVPMSAAHVRQAVNNLIGNALLHGQGPVAVHVRGVEDTAVLTVTDDGTGVDPALLPTAADRFARADGARSRPGAGLGLALVRTLVEQAGGELRLCSNGTHHRYQDRFGLSCAHGPEGTTASVLLPVQP
ncbi:MAG: ATP-binding region, ATPase domain protein [Frankiales bacterium]|nr:ATP-binding region, ATPase domain protein [Frankiales bacterium]